MVRPQGEAARCFSFLDKGGEEISRPGTLTAAVDQRTIARTI